MLFIKSTVWDNPNVFVELFKGVNREMAKNILKHKQGGSHDLFVLLRCTLPYLINQLLWHRVLAINTPDIENLQRSFDNLSVRVLYENVLNQSVLNHPL